MFMGFILRIYIIFGTNLLTGGPTRIAVFLPISVFRRKGISNGVQTEWNLRERDFWNEQDPESLECKSRSSRGPHEIGGRAPCLVGPSGGHRRTSSSYISLRTRKHLGSQQNTISTAVTFCIREIPSWSLRRHSAGGRIDHGGLLHQHHSLSDEVWVVYLRPSSPQLLARWLLLSFWIYIQCSPPLLWRSIQCNLFLRYVCRDPMNCGSTIKFIYE